jgi:hypothetical protein
LARPWSHISYANVTATLALFAALGGGAYAAVTLERNSVKSRHIGPGQVKRPDIARNAVDSRRVRNGSLLAADFRAGQLPRGETGPQGPQGPAGPQGLTGQTGQTGPPGPTKGAVSDNLEPSPSPFGCCFSPAEITLEETSKVLVVVSFDGAFIICGSPGCQLILGAYVETGPGSGTPVPDTGYSVTLPANMSDDHISPTVSGIVELPPGTHRIAAGYDRVGTTMTASPGQTSTTLVMLGG